jgi:hypothetical protein
MRTYVRPLQSAEVPKDVNKVMARFVLVLPWRGRDRAEQEVFDGEKASIKAHEKSGEAAEEYIE